MDLKEALTVTFCHRETKIEERFLIYKDDYKQNSQEQIQWSSFLERNKLNTERNFTNVIDLIQSFIEPIFSQEMQSWDPIKFIWE